MAGSLEIQLLGDFRLLHNGVPVTTIETPKRQSFLAYLLLHRAAPQSRSRLAFLFWPDSTEAQARTNLRKQLYHLTRDLPDAQRYLYADANVIDWRTGEGLTVDVAEFERALAEARAAEQAGSEDEQVAALERAVALYQGDLLPNSYDDWVLEERQRLQQACAGALLTLASLLERRREYDAGVQHIKHLLRLDPLHEPGWRQLMRLQALQGNRAAAIASYHTCAARLEEELGVSPGAATEQLYQQLLQQEAASPEPAMPSAFACPLVGRRGEWAQLLAAWQATQEGRRHLVLISGEAGIGKTRLAEELRAWASRLGISTAVAHCYASEQGLPYGPVTIWLRSEPLNQALAALEPAWLGEIARLLPELLVERPGLTPPWPMTEDWQRQHLFEALVRPFAYHRQMILFVEDLHRADQGTLDWLPYLLHAQAASAQPGRLLVVATARTGELAGSQGLNTLLGDLRQGQQLTNIELGPLTKAESLDLARTVAGRVLEPQLAEELYRESEGNPLFVVELVRAAILSPEGTERGPASHPGRWGLPIAVQRAISDRLAQLSPAARDLAGVAAVMGRRFNFDILLRAASTLDKTAGEAAIVSALDELWQRDIVSPQGATDYYFVHDKIRLVVYEELSPVRRRYLHQRVADALVDSHSNALDAVSAQVADHYERGGQPVEAIAYRRRAAAVARRVYANEEAIDHYRHLLESDLSQQLPRADACAIMLDLGQVWQLTGDWAAAEELYRRALVQAEILEDLALVARCQQAIGNLVRLRGKYEEALEWLSLAHDNLLTAGEQQGLAQVLWAMGEALWYQGDHQGALAALQRQMEISETLGDLYGLCDAAGTMGIVYWSLGEFEKARALCRQSMDTAEQIGHWWAVGRALLTMGNTYMGEGHLLPAYTCYEQALEVGSQIGDRQCRSWAVINMGNLYGMAGDQDSALACYQFGLETALEVGDRWSISIGLVDMAEVYSDKGQVAQAEGFYELGVALARVLGANYLGEYLLSLAGFYAELGRFEEAEHHNEEALQLAGRSSHLYMAGRNTRFHCSLLSVRLRHALGQMGRAAAVAELEQMLAACTGDAQRAEVWYEIWRLAPAYALDGRSLSDLYRSLPPNQIYGAIRRQYREVTGNVPPAPEALPALPEVVHRPSAGVEQLLTRARRILADLQTPSS